MSVGLPIRARSIVGFGGHHGLTSNAGRLGNGASRTQHVEQTMTSAESNAHVASPAAADAGGPDSPLDNFPRSARLATPPGERCREQLGRVQKSRIPRRYTRDGQQVSQNTGMRPALQTCSLARPF
jgi:hypothetical protein